MRNNTHTLPQLVALALAMVATVAGQSVNNRTARVSWAALTTTGATGSFDVRALTPSKHTLQLVVTGSPTTCAVQLEGSLDNVNWANLSGSQNCASVTVFHVDAKPMDFVRVNLTGLSGGSSPAVTPFYVGVF